MPVPSADKKTLSHRLRWLAVGTALAIAAIVGANALILTQLHHSTLREVQDNLLRQSLGLSELVERTLQATDLMLTSVAERAGALASTEDGTQQLESEAFHILLKEKMSGLPQVHVLGYARCQRHPFEPLAVLAGAEDRCFVSSNISKC